MSTEIRKVLIEERRKRFLASLIREAVTNVLAEQDQQGAPSAAPAAPPAPAASPATTASPPTPGNELASPDQAGTKVFTVDDMIERLNVIRGGRSFTDPEVYGRLVTYFKTLDDASRESLEKFLIELGKIVIDVGQEKPAGDQDGNAPPAAPPPAQAAPEAPPAAPIAPPAV